MKLKSPLTPLALSLGLLLSTHPTHAQMCLANPSGTHKVVNTGNTGTQCSADPNLSARTNHATTTAPTSSAFAPNTFVSNPINVLSGNKFERVDDLILDETDPYALNLTRYYNSQSTQKGIFGMGWRSSFEIQLQHTTYSNQANQLNQDTNLTAPTDTIQILSTDGTLYHFYKTQVSDKDNPNLKHIHYTHPDPSLGYITQAQNNNNGEHWHWHLPDGRRFGFVLHKQANQQAQRLNKAHHHTTKQPTAHTATHTYGQLSSVYQNPQKPHLGHYQLRYDTKGRLAKVTNHQGQSLSFTYQTTKHNLPYITVQSPIGTSHYFLDKHHNLSQVVNPNGIRVGYGYTNLNDKHNLTAKYHYTNQTNTKNSNQTTPNQKPTQNQAILIQSWVYDAYDRAILSTEPNGQNKVSIRYDDSLWHAYQTNQTNQQNQKTYINTLTNSLGQTTQYHYTYTPQTGFRLIKAVGAGCSTCDESTINHSFVYNDKGGVIQKQTLDPKGNPTDGILIDYDDKGNIKEIKSTPTNPPSTNTPNSVLYQRFEYQNPKHPTKPSKIIRPSVVKGKETIIELDYDDDGDIITMTQMGYDLEGNPIKEALPVHNQKTNDKENQSVIKSPNTSDDAIDVLYDFIAKSEQRVNIAQDKTGKPTSIKLSTGTTYHRNYDDFGRLTHATDPNTGKYKLAYDTQDKLTTITSEIAVQYVTYDDKGLAKSLRTCDNIDKSRCQTIAYHYNDNGQLTAIDTDRYDITYDYLPTGTAQTEIITLDNKNYPMQYGYDNQNRLNKIILPEGLVLNYAYNEAGKIINANYQLPSTGLWQSLTRKINNKKDFQSLSIHNPIQPNDKKSTHNGKQDIAYTLDANNNRLSRYENGVITTYNYQTNTDRLTHINHPDYQITYEYNQVGSPTKITKTDKNNKVSVQTISYTPDNQIKAIYQDGVLIADYDYNHLRQRIEKTVYLKDDKTNQIQKETTNYLWHNGLLSAEIQNGNITRRYIYMDITPIAVIDYTYNNKGKMMTAQLYTVHTDHLGTPKQITDQNNQMVWQADYEDFGKATITTKDNFQFNLRFAGQYYDNETGYHYNTNRYYNPETGRYLTADPLGLSGGLNSYVYANHEPWEYVDVLGLYTIQDAINQLDKEKAKKLGTKSEFAVLTPAGPVYNEIPDYSNTQKFCMWLRMEKEYLKKTRWLDELNDRKCPATLQDIESDREKNPKNTVWEKPSNNPKVKVFHWGATWEVRSKPTKNYHSSQCTYDKNKRLLKNPPAAGSADFKACTEQECKQHYEHDVVTFMLAEKLKRINDYYSVRPLIY